MGSFQHPLFIHLLTTYHSILINNFNISEHKEQSFGFFFFFFGDIFTQSYELSEITKKEKKWSSRIARIRIKL